MAVFCSSTHGDWPTAAPLLSRVSFLNKKKLQSKASDVPVPGRVLALISCGSSAVDSRIFRRLCTDLYFPDPDPDPEHMALTLYFRTSICISGNWLKLKHRQIFLARYQWVFQEKIVKRSGWTSRNWIQINFQVETTQININRTSTANTRILVPVLLFKTRTLPTPTIQKRR